MDNNTKRRKEKNIVERSEPTNRALEELFRVPIFDSESQRSFVEDYSEEDHEGLTNTKEQLSVVAKNDRNKLHNEKVGDGDSAKTEYRQQMLNLLQGKQGLVWARKLFFLSTEMIFPGFVRSAEAQNRIGYYMGVRVRSSCLLQLILYADMFFFIFWALSFICTFDITISVLKQLHGYLFICLAILFSIINVARTRFGFWGNENDEVQYLALYWMTTAIVELPLLGFIVFTDIFSPVVLPYIVTMDSIMLSFILLESVVGFYHFNNLLRDEIKIIRMARRTENIIRSRAATAHLQPKITNTIDGPHVEWTSKQELDDGPESSLEESFETNVPSTSAMVQSNIGSFQPKTNKLPIKNSNKKNKSNEETMDEKKNTRHYRPDLQEDSSSSLSLYDNDNNIKTIPKSKRNKEK